MMTPPDTASAAELLSLVTDGRLAAGANPQTHAAWAKALQAPDCAALWQCNQLIGDVLRQQAPATRGTRNQAQWLQGLQHRLNQEQQHGSPALVGAAAVDPTSIQRPAANQSPAANDRFWKMVAGASSVFGLGAIAVALTVTGGNRPDGVQSVARSPAVNVPAASSGPAPAVLAVNDNMGPMIRDPRLMERMSQHRQFGGTGVHASTAFIRNATFEQVHCANPAPAVAGAAVSNC